MQMMRLIKGDVMELFIYVAHMCDEVIIKAYKCTICIHSITKLQQKQNCQNLVNNYVINTPSDASLCVSA